MGVTRQEVLSVQPEVTEGRGRWLAVSKQGSDFRIGVLGATEAEARERFDGQLRRWADCVDSAVSG